MKRGYIQLEDGTRFDGYSFGAEKNTVGEVVFNTAMNGYPESLTDPSFMGQILVETYPMIGNYGMPSNTFTPEGISDLLESDKIWIQGLIVTNYSTQYSHWNAATSLQQMLIAEGIPALSDIDTRALTKHLREKGCCKGKIIIEDVAKSPIDEHFEERNLIKEASCKEVIKYGAGDTTIIFIDCGTKHNILRKLQRPGYTVIRVPWDYDFTNIAYDGVFISNGPGNPIHADKTIQILRKAFDIGKPIWGICMGNQLLALAAGAKITKMKYGHRSHNQPVQHCNSKKCYITSQNHSFVVDPSTLPSEWEELFINLNDGTNEGICHKSKPFASVQFHPECCGGPTDTLFFFNDFLETVDKYKKLSRHEA